MFLKLPLALLTVLTVLTSAAGQVKSSTAPVPAASAPDSKQDYSKEAYVVDRFYTHITEAGDGTGVREVTSEVKILAEAGVKAFAVLDLTYSSANQTVDIDYVRVRKPDGTVVKTPDYNIQDMPADVSRTAPLYSDIHEKHIAVRGLGVGDVLEYLVRFRTTKAEVPGQFWSEYSFTKHAIERDEQLELNVPSDKYLKVVSPEFKPEIVEEGTHRTYKWKHTNLAVKEKDPDEIPLRIRPNPDIQWTTFSSWADVGAWYGGLQKDPMQITPGIQAKAAELTKGLASDDEKIHALYNFVSLKYHYIGLDFGIGRYQPHPADDVLDNGYGDCKDKHTLLAALLKAAGYDAWPALIHPQRKLDPEVPSPAQFNHVITVVPRDGGDVIWLDTTPEVAPYRLLVPSLRDEDALVIPTGKPALLMKTPANPPFPMEQEFNSSGKLSAEGTYTGHIEQSYRGDTEVVFREGFRRLPQSQWKDGVQRLSYGMNFGGDVSNVKVSPPDDIDSPFKISYDYTRKNFADWEDQNTNAALPPVGLEVTKDSKVKKPQEPIFLGAIGTVVYRSRMELPPGYSVVPSPRLAQTNPYAEYKSNTVFDDGVLTISRELTIKKTEIPVREYDRFREFGRAIADDEFGFMHLSHTGGTTARKHGDDTDDDADDKADERADDKAEDSEDIDKTFRRAAQAIQMRDNHRAEELLKKIIARDPKYKRAHVSLGIVLLSENKLAEALAEFHKEQEISPGEVLNYEAPAGVLAATGHRDEAMVEYRSLLKIDPRNTDGALSLGHLLSIDGKYSAEAEVLEAALKASPDNMTLQMALGQAELKSGQAEQGVSHLKAAVAQRDDDPMILNEASYSLAESKTSLDLAREYGEKAVDELEDSARGSESSDAAGLDVTYQFSLVWDTLGWVYFQQGDAKRAESLVRSAWLLGEDPLVAEHLGQIYEKEGRPQEAAHAYEWALALSSLPAFPSLMGVPETDTMKEQKKAADEITARYQKLTGKKPELRVTNRLPNGEWTQTPAEHLRHTREVTLTNEAKLAGMAEFTVVFKPGKVESASYTSGDNDLEPLAKKLQAAHFPLEFPPESEAILVMKVEVRCHATSTCVGTLVNPLPPGR
jgi:tetratricopeptide (TPR) repeat protein/transglutaminase-like putative cysteine protease